MTCAARMSSLCERAREKNDLNQVNFNEQMYILSNLKMSPVITSIKEKTATY